jgi:GT2 family glycosyltransferase
MRASVITVTYNHAAIVGQCLAALRATLGPDDEVIVVDNGSADGTADVVARDFPWARLLRTGANLGYGGANNLAARRAAGDYLVFLNPDTRPYTGWLDALIAPIAPIVGRAGGGAGLTTAKLLLASTPDLVDTFGNDVHLSGITPCRGWRAPAARLTGPETVSAVSGACFAISRALFLRLGGFDARLFLYYEDTDLSLRARLAGERILAVPDALVLHDHAPGFSPAKLRYLERNRWWTLLKLLQPRTLCALLPVLLLAEALAWGMALASGPRHVLAKARSWLDLLAWLPSLPAARAAAARTRCVRDADLLRLHGTRLSFAQTGSGPLYAAAELLTAAVSGGGRALASVALR